MIRLVISKTRRFFPSDEKSTHRVRVKASYFLFEEHRRVARMKVNPSSFETHSGGWEGLRRKWIRIHLLSSILDSMNHARFGLQTVFSITQSDHSISYTGFLSSNLEMLCFHVDVFAGLCVISHNESWACRRVRTATIRHRLRRKQTR
jgi:hypothetical protein